MPIRRLFRGSSVPTLYPQGVFPHRHSPASGPAAPIEDSGVPASKAHPVRPERPPSISAPGRAGPVPQRTAIGLNQLSYDSAQVDIPSASRAAPAVRVRPESILTPSRHPSGHFPSAGRRAPMGP
ncbi:hypothetical protein GCM10018781_43670 [Kitasatospora indigofera]|uniref:Uncharacterized protein n=1 Tax=Kitasatospora indigofera TaxID=67307 RepID=A0A919G098_9ACTN|nr:hypothetical protein GCM10018781_43670 [Kitasatospora indigofera]